MNRRNVVLLCAIVALAIPLGASAQSFGSTNATSGVFLSNTDKATSTTDYSEVTRNLFWLNDGGTLNAGFGYHISNTIWLAGVYNGNVFSKNGGLFDPSSNPNVSGTTSVTTTYNLDPSNNIISTKVVTQPNDLLNNTTANSFRALLGIGGNLGIAASVNQAANFQTGTFDSTFTNQKSTTTVTTDSSGNTIAKSATTYLEGRKTTTDYIQPGAEAGYRLAMGNNLLKAKVGVGVTLNNIENLGGSTSYLQAIGSGFPTFQSITEVQNYTAIKKDYLGSNMNLSANAGGTFSMPVGKNMLELGGSYTFDMPFYNNGYTDAAGKAQTAKGTVTTYTETQYKVAQTPSITVAPSTTSGNSLSASFTSSSDLGSTGEVATTNVDMNTISKYTHTIDPQIKYIASLSNNLTLGALIIPEVVYAYTSDQHTFTDTMTATYTASPGASSNNSTETATAAYTGDQTVTKELDLNPTLSFGLQYYIIPKTLRLNLGATATISKLYSKSDIHTVPGLTTVTDTNTTSSGTTTTTSTTLGNSRTETSTDYFSMSGAQIVPTGGVTWNLNDNASLDLLFSVVGGSTLVPAEMTVQFTYSH